MPCVILVLLWNLSHNLTSRASVFFFLHYRALRARGTKAVCQAPRCLFVCRLRRLQGGERKQALRSRVWTSGSGRGGELLCGLLRYERPPVCLRGAESRRSRAGELRVPASGPTPEPPPGADDGDPGVPAADGELPPYHGTSLGQQHEDLRRKKKISQQHFREVIQQEIYGQTQQVPYYTYFKTMQHWFQQSSLALLIISPPQKKCSQ